MVNLLINEMRSVLGEKTGELVKYFYTVLEFISQNGNDNTESNDIEMARIASDIISSIEKYLTYEVPAKDCYDQFALYVEKHLKMLCYLIDRNEYRLITSGSEVFKKLIIWSGEVETNSKGNLELNCSSFNDCRKKPGEKKYWSMAYTIRNKEAHWTANLNRTEADEVIVAALYVLITCTWNHKEELEGSINKIRGSKIFDEKQYFDSIINAYEKENKHNTYTLLNLVTCDEERRMVHEMQDILSQLEENTIVNILGEAGAGKSRLFEHMQYLEAKERKVLPIYIELKDLVDEKSSIKALIRKKINLPGDKLELVLQRKIHLYLDGVNEILASGKIKHSLCRSIVEFLESHPSIKAFISDRENTSITVFKDAPTLRMCKLSNDVVEKFVERNCNEENRTRVIQCAKQIKDDLTPLMLLLLIDYVKDNGQDEEITTWNIISHYINGLINREVMEKGDTTAKNIPIFLAYLAADYDDESGCKKGQIVKIFAKCINELALSTEGYDPHKYIDELLVDGMKLLQKTQEGTYYFANKVYEDYFYMYGLDEGFIEYE